MIEKNITIESKTGSEFQVGTYTLESLTPERLRMLSVKYATDFWAGPWKELVVDANGNQYGSMDSEGRIYPETQQLLEINGILLQAGWGLKMWEKAVQGNLVDSNGNPLLPFWSLEKAQEELQLFIKPIEQGGFGGEIMIVTSPTGEIAGFTAYTVTSNPKIAEKRFPGKLRANNGNELALGDLLTKEYGEADCGIYLDFAISENYRSDGLGSQLFDARLSRLQELGANVIVGRTLITQPAQYQGNYIARGMYPIASDSMNPDKIILAARAEEIIPRVRRRNI